MHIKTSQAKERIIPATRKQHSRYPISGSYVSSLCVVKEENLLLHELVEDGVVFDIVFVIGLDFSCDAVQCALQSILG